VSSKQAVATALLLAAVCCLVMWWLEGFRQRKWLDQLRAELATIPTYLGGEQQ